MDQQALSQKKPIDYVKIIFRRKWLLIIPVTLGIIGGVIAANTLPKIYRASTLILVEEGRIINPLIKGLAVSTSTAQRLSVLREQILGWDRIKQLISTLDLATDVKTQLQFEGLVSALRKNIKVKLLNQSIVSMSFEGKNPVQVKNIVQTITDIFIAENLRQQNQETNNAIAFINDQLALYQQKVKQGEISALEDQLTVLLADSTEKHPMVVDLRKKIAIANEELGRGDYTVKVASIGGSEEDLKALKGELQQMREELATSSLDASDGGANRARLSSATNEKLYKLLLLERIEKVGAQDIGVNQALYNTLLERLETAKITQSLEASKEGTRYTILDPARLPLEPIKPNKPLVLLMAIFIGSCAGIGLIFSIEMFDHSFLGVDEAKEFLDLPIFGAISKIVTKADVRIQKLHNAKIAAISAITGVALLIVIIFNVILGG